MGAMADHPLVAFDVRMPGQRAAFVAHDVGLFAASCAAVGMIIGSFCQWGTAFGLIKVSGTRMHSATEVAIGILGLTMVALHRLRRADLPLIIAAAGGALGALQAMVTLGRIGSDGAVTVLGMNYRFLRPAWGLYLVLVSAIALVGSTLVAWQAARLMSRRGDL